MTKKQIKILAKDSYTKNMLDAKKVKKIAKLLNREGLKVYIKELRFIEKQKKVEVLIPSNKIGKDADIEKMFSRVFQDKNISVARDPSLILGVRITDNDLIYDLNLKNTLDDLNKHIMDNYD